MTATITDIATLEVTSCPNCGLTYAVPALWLQNRRDDRVSFFCPNGHSLSYRTSKAERLQKELNAKEEELRQAQYQRDQEQTRAANLAKKVKAAEALTKRNAARTKAGVCTCCNRTFKQLAAHMKNMHPEVKP